MFGRQARVHCVLILLVLASAAKAGVLCAPRTVEGAPAMSTTYCPAEVPGNSTSSAVTPMANHASDIPSAPLPPAIWPGLAVLVVLGSVKVAFRPRHRGIRI